MESKPLVSILIPIYIQDEQQIIHLRQSLDSVINQTYQQIEVILINDGCIDAAKLLLNEYQENFPHIIVHHNHENKGIVASLNTGIKLSSGEFIARHDSDDICFPERIEQQINYILKHPECCAVFTGSININSTGQKSDYFPVSESPQRIKAELLFNSRLRHPSLLVRKQSLININGYQNQLLAEDYDLFCRLSLEGELHGINTPLLFYRLYVDANPEKRQRQLASAASISYQYVAKLITENSHKTLREDSFNRFWYHIQSRGMTPCTIVDVLHLAPLWQLLETMPLAKEVWHKEIKNCVKHGYHRRSKIQACLMYFYLKARLSI